MLSRMSAVIGGVTSRPLRTMKNVAPVPSATCPCPVEEDRLIVAVGIRLQRREPAVLVVGAALQTDGDRVVRTCAPRAHAAPEAAAFFDAAAGAAG